MLGHPGALYLSHVSGLCKGGGPPTLHGIQALKKGNLKAPQDPQALLTETGILPPISLECVTFICLDFVTAFVATLLSG